MNEYLWGNGNIVVILFIIYQFVLFAGIAYCQAVEMQIKRAERRNRVAIQHYLRIASNVRLKNSLIKTIGETIDSKKGRLL